VQTELVPRAREFDEMGRLDRSIFPKMGELGLLGIRYDEKWGGQGLDYSYQAIFLEEVALCDNAGVCMGISVQTDMATPALHRFGSDELKKRYLVPAIKGEHVAAIAVTEPSAGSDVSGIRTRAVRDGDHWVINGSKMYITNAATADWLCLLAVTDPEAGYGGYTQIIVPTDSRGFSYKLLDKIGNVGSDTGLLFFDDVRVPISNTIGDAEPWLPAADDAVPGRAHGRRRDGARHRAAALGGDAPPLPAAHALREAARQDAGDAVQARRADDPDHRGARSSRAAASGR
jgi:citronellyl-CoA dehydrogenase